MEGLKTLKDLKNYYDPIWCTSCKSNEILKQEAIIIKDNEQRKERIKIIGFPNYPKYIFKKLLERELKEKIEYGFVIHPVFKKSCYDIKLNKTIIPSVSKSFFMINNGDISLFLYENAPNSNSKGASHSLNKD
jgi:hypothetical protein